MKKLNSNLIDKSIIERKFFIKPPNLSMLKVKSMKNKNSPMQNSLKNRLNEIALLSKDVSGKYQIKEQEIYDRLYLKVRKLFLEGL